MSHNALRAPLRAAIGAVALCLTATASATAQARLNKYGYPEKLAPRPTSAAINEQDLMTRLYIFADDSMQGRAFGRVGNMRGTNYIASEVRRLGLQPAGDSGTFFQRLPMGQQHFTERSTLNVEGVTLRMNTDFVPLPSPRAPKAIQNASVIFGGMAGDTTTMISPEQAAGKLVVLLGNPAATGGRGAGAGGRGGGNAPGGAAMNPCLAIFGGQGAARGAGFAFGPVGANVNARFANATAIATVDLDMTPIGQRAFINNPAARPRQNPPMTPRAPIVYINNGRIATLQNGELVGGELPLGMTAQQVQQMIDSIRVDSIGRVQRTTAFTRQEQLRACEVQDSIAVSHGAPSMRPAGGVSAAVADANAGGRGGRGGGGRGAGGGAVDGAPASLRITRAAAEKLFGRAVDGLTAGTAGKSVNGALDWEDRDAADWARNVVALIPGSDPSLKNQYVLISAHNDHVGFSVNTVDHDSLKAWNDYRTRIQLSRRPGDLGAGPTAQEIAAFRVNLDSLRRIRPARLDSISNGADDDGSGSMAILEIAENIARMPVKPKRSTLFVWQTGEESGLNGSAYFAAHPTVPVDSIVADINIDMIGRGRAEDIPGGGPTYVAVVGSGFLSAELAQMVASTNMKQKQPLALDPKFDLYTSWPGYNNIYGRSDHYNYAQQCIPIAFFFTGLHGDYHQRTDEPQYIDYPHYSLITNYVRDLVVEIATRPQRPSLEKPCMRVIR